MVTFNVAHLNAPFLPVILRRLLEKRIIIFNHINKPKQNMLMTVSNERLQPVISTVRHVCHLLLKDREIRLIF